MTTALKRLRTLRRDTSGLALMEFAFTMPIVLLMGGSGIELSFYALTNLRVSQYALNLADNASRIGTMAGVVQQLREVDINDVLQGTRLESKITDLTANGRVTLSSLENIKQSYDTTRKQRIHWQRCIGILPGAGFDSKYGSTTPSAGSTDTLADAGLDKPDGMGDPGREVKAMDDTGVMFVEVNYHYKPAFGSMFSSLFENVEIIHYTASFMVRDNRDFTRVYNPNPGAPASTCDKYTL